MFLSKAIDNLFDRVDAQLQKNGWTTKRYNVLDATLVAASKQRNNDGETRLVISGETA